MKRKCAKKKASRNGPRGGEQRDAAVLVKAECEADDVDHLDIRIKEEPDPQDIDEEHNGHSDLDAATSEALHHHERVKVESDDQQVKEEPPGCWVKEEEQDREEEEEEAGGEEEEEGGEVIAGRCSASASCLRPACVPVSCLSCCCFCCCCRHPSLSAI